MKQVNVKSLDTTIEHLKKLKNLHIRGDRHFSKLCDDASTRKEYGSYLARADRHEMAAAYIADAIDRLIEADKEIRALQRLRNSRVKR